jgi:hypothetical protein
VIRDNGVYQITGKQHAATGGVTDRRGGAQRWHRRRWMGANR